MLGTMSNTDSDSWDHVQTESEDERERRRKDKVANETIVVLDRAFQSSWDRKQGKGFSSKTSRALQDVMKMAKGAI